MNDLDKAVKGAEAIYEAANSLVRKHYSRDYALTPVMAQLIATELLRNEVARLNDNLRPKRQQFPFTG